MGGQQATEQQLINYYIANAKLHTNTSNCGAVNPTTYFPNCYGISLQTFVEDYISEANALGIRPEVAFAQMCDETGFLRFGGQVSIGQDNFAGIGALDSGGAGATFASVQQGILAQVEHLYAYAATSPLPAGCNPAVDPRFGMVTRGSAPAVEDLSGTWASSSTYGNDLINMINAILATSTQNIYNYSSVPSLLVTVTSSPTVSASPSPSPSPSESVEPSPTVSANPTPSPTVSESPTPSPSESGSPTPSSSESASPSPSSSESASPSPSASAALSTDSQPQQEPYLIMGGSAVTNQQLMDVFAQYQETNPLPAGTAGYDQNGFPIYYGLTIDQFIGQYIQEAVSEGIKPEVGFAQAMAETDYLRFTGNIGISQYNFGGFETNGTPDVFSDLKTGITAQVQHLKCYASSEPCVSPVVDTHWDNNVRGTATTVQAILASWSKNDSYSETIWTILNKLN